MQGWDKDAFSRRSLALCIASVTASFGLTKWAGLGDAAALFWSVVIDRVIASKANGRPALVQTVIGARLPPAATSLNRAPPASVVTLPREDKQRTREQAQLRADALREISAHNLARRDHRFLRLVA